jgi:hypothetical protein
VAYNPAFFFSFSVESDKMVKKKPKFGAIPTLNMPKRVHDTVTPAPRPPRTVVKEDSCKLSFTRDQENSKCYKSIKELCKRVETLKVTKDWASEKLDDRLILKKISKYRNLLCSQNFS